MNFETIVDAKSSNLNVEKTDWAIRETLLQGGLSDGVHVVEIDNGALQVSVLPTRGMGIWKASYQGIPIGWESPVRKPVHPHFVNLHSRNNLGWLEGFNELMCRCGLAFNGPPGHDEGAASPLESDLTLHGRIANLPAHSVDVFANEQNGGTLGITGTVDECSLFGPQLRMESTISTTLGSNAFTIHDTITNLGATPTELQLLYHTNFGRPFLEAGSKFVCATAEVTPRDHRAAEGINSYSDYLGPTSGYAEQVYFFRLLADSEGQTEVLLRNATGDCGVSLRFPQQQLPCFALWKCTQPEAAGYVTGLEPGLNYPNFKAFERHHNRVVNLEAGHSYQAVLSIEVHTTQSAVTAAEERITALQQETPAINTRPAAPFAQID